MDISSTLVLTIIVVTYWIWWRWKKTSLFQELGVPGPKPSLFFGNLIELFQKGPLQSQDDWLKKYGNVVGYYYGMRPMLLVADLQLIKKICIKDFNLFSDRPETVPLRVKGLLDYILPTRTIFDSMLVNLKGERWKSVRNLLSPTFSTAKMKLMSPTINEAIAELLSKLQKAAENKDVIDIYDCMQGLTLDVICRSAFAVQIDVQKNSDNPYLRSAKLTLGLNYTSPLIFLAQSFPELAIIPMVVFYGTALICNKLSIPPLKITGMLNSAIKGRRKNPHVGVPDLLRLMMEASTHESTSKNPHDDAISLEKRKVTAHNKNKISLTDLEIQANALVVLLAGYESTSSTLAFAFHFLSKDRVLQEKARDEIDELRQREGELSYSSVIQLPLLDRFVSETLRYYPPVIHFMYRMAATDVQYDGLRIPKGLQIHIPLYHIHHNAKYWSDPEKFDPDRFLPENKRPDFNAMYIPFGVGPRNCIGLRFGLMEVKMTIAKLLSYFEFFPDDNDEIEVCTTLTNSHPEKVLVKLKSRKFEDRKI